MFSIDWAAGSSTSDTVGETFDLMQSFFWVNVTPAGGPGGVSAGSADMFGGGGFQSSVAAAAAGPPVAAANTATVPSVADINRVLRAGAQKPRRAPTAAKGANPPS